MKRKTMKDLVDGVYFVQLAEQDPADVCRRAMCSFDADARTYGVSVWGRSCTVDLENRQIFCAGPEEEPLHPYFELFLIHYLLGAADIMPAEEWISEKDIPGGATFFRGPHEIPAHKVVSRFDQDITGFNNWCEKQGGKKLNLADAAWEFSITPRIPVAVLFWQGDDEFPTEAKLLFDKTIVRHLASDIIYALAVGVCDQLS